MLTSFIQQFVNPFSKTKYGPVLKRFALSACLFVAIAFMPVRILAVAPVITSFSPSAGGAGTLVTITGTNLANPSSFSIGGVSAVVITNSGTTLVGMVMPGALTGAVSVTTSAGTATAAGSFTVDPAPCPTQPVSKLVGSGGSPTSYQGGATAISADGNTIVTGAWGDGGGTGAVWIYNRSGGVWTQQGSKLVGTGAIGTSHQGCNVAIAGDGNTILVGGYSDSSGTGAAWVYTRSGGTWTQQGNKLVGTGAVGAADQGWSVALSADGNTAIIGGYLDNGLDGAAWVFTRLGGIWSQQGSKLVGTGVSVYAEQGISVALSADGNTALVSGLADNSNEGAAWVFTRSAGVWTQQGTKLTGTGNSGAMMGRAIALSADGNTALLGGDTDQSGLGAAWVFIRSGGIWSQQGNKLVGSGAVGTAAQGGAVSLSADGNIAIIGGDMDNSNQGAAWIFTRSAGVWTQQGNKLLGSAASATAGLGSGVAISADATTAIIGGYKDNSQQGAVWVYTNGAMGIETISATGFLTLYPNPAQNTLNLQQNREGINLAALIGIMNSKGQEVMREQKILGEGNTVSLDISILPPGLYFLRIVNDKEVDVVKFIKQ